MAQRSDDADDWHDTERVDEAVLALLYLTSFQEGDVVRAWKGHDWDALDRLHAKHYISDPASKAKSVVLSEEGYAQARRLFDQLFGKVGA